MRSCESNDALTVAQVELRAPAERLDFKIKQFLELLPSPSKHSKSSPVTFDAVPMSKGLAMPEKHSRYIIRKD